MGGGEAIAPELAWSWIVCEPQSPHGDVGECAQNDRIFLARDVAVVEVHFADFVWANTRNPPKETDSAPPALRQWRAVRLAVDGFQRGQLEEAQRCNA